MTKKMRQPAIGILGGAFDPIHLGHLRAAQEVMQRLPVQEIRFIPCQNPVHKAATAATTKQRLAMLQLALADSPHFKIDERELNRPTPSYMVETLNSLQAEMTTQALWLILGTDAFAHFTSWYRWQQILALANIIIVSRPGYLFSAHNASYEVVKQHHTLDIEQLIEQPVGVIFQLEILGVEVSSSQIRKMLPAGEDPRHLVPAQVAAYIEKHQLYQTRSF